MAMQGKSTSGDQPSLSADEAEAAADAFRPAWDAETEDTDPGGKGSVTMVTAPPVASPPSAPGSAPNSTTIVGAPVINVGAPVSEPAKPEPPKASEPPKPTAAASLSKATKLGISPEAQAVVAAANAANNTASSTTTKLGISAEAQSVVAAANAAFGGAASAAMKATRPSEAPPPASTTQVNGPASATMVSPPPASATIPDVPVPKTEPIPAPVRAPAPSAEALDSASVIEAIPAAEITERTAPPKPEVPKTVRVSERPAAFQAVDPFRSPAPSDDFAPPKKGSRALVFGAFAVAAIIGVVLFIKLGSGGDAPPSPTPAPTQLGPTAQSPANDIPPPPPKDEVPPAPAATPAPKPEHTAKPEPPTPTPVATPAPAPRPVAAPPRFSPARTPPPQPAPTPKTPPKPTGGGIVRDSPF